MSFTGLIAVNPTDDYAQFGLGLAASRAGRAGSRRRAPGPGGRDAARRWPLRAAHCAASGPGELRGRHDRPRTAGPAAGGSEQPPAPRSTSPCSTSTASSTWGRTPCPASRPPSPRPGSRGMRLGFVTNNASRRPDEVAAHLTELGVPAEVEDVITSAQAAATVVARQLGAGARVLPVAAPASPPRSRRPGSRSSTGPRTSRWPSSRATAGRSAGRSSPRRWSPSGTAPGTSRPTPTRPSPRPVGRCPGNGALVGVVSAVTGQQPQVTGKPDPAMHEECVRRTGARTPLVVGDRLDTDIEGARRAGAASLLVLTGVTDPGTLLGGGSDAPPGPARRRRRRAARGPSGGAGRRRRLAVRRLDGGRARRRRRAALTAGRRRRRASAGWTASARSAWRTGRRTPTARPLRPRSPPTTAAREALRRWGLAGRP